VGLAGFEFRTHHDVDETRVVIREIPENVTSYGFAKGDTKELVILADAIGDVRIAGALLRHVTFLSSFDHRLLR